MEQRITPGAPLLIPKHHRKVQITAEHHGAGWRITKHHGSLVYLMIYSLFQSSLYIDTSERDIGRESY